MEMTLEQTCWVVVAISTPIYYFLRLYLEWKKVNKP